MKTRLLHFPAFISFIIVFLTLTGCIATEKESVIYEDGLLRSTPEEQGVPSETIAKFFQNVEEKGYDVHGLMMFVMVK